MIKPNFSEATLQTVSNCELILSKDKSILPIIPSLKEEYNLGYDTEFQDFFSTGHSLFIQYKLSSLIQETKSKQWKYWGQEYYKFSLYHNKKKSKRLHQYETLIKLAKENYANKVVYATNSFVSLFSLFDYFKNSQLSSHIYCLDVSDIKKSPHYDVTFTDKSSDFMLHSSVEQVGINNLEKIISNHLSTQFSSHEIENYFLNFLKTQDSKNNDIKKFISNLVQSENSLINCFKSIENTVNQLSDLELDNHKLAKLKQYPEKISKLENDYIYKLKKKISVLKKKISVLEENNIDLKKNKIKSKNNNEDKERNEKIASLHSELDNQLIKYNNLLLLNLSLDKKNLNLNSIVEKISIEFKLCTDYGWSQDLNKILFIIRKYRDKNNEINKLKFGLFKEYDKYKKIHKRYLNDFSSFMKKYLNVNCYWSTLPETSFKLVDLPKKVSPRKPAPNSKVIINKNII